MFDAFMHYIIQHHYIFPRLTEVHYHWYCPGDAYDLDAILLVVDNLPRPLILPRRARCLTITVDDGALEDIDRVRSQVEIPLEISPWLS